MGKLPMENNRVSPTWGYYVTFYIKKLKGYIYYFKKIMCYLVADR